METKPEVKPETETSKQKAIRILCTVAVILILIGLTGYTLYQCGAFSSKQLLTTAYASDITVDNYLTGTGYIFRDETVIAAEEPSVSDSAVTPGGKVSAGAKLTTLYACADGQEATEKQRRLAKLDAQIEFLVRCGSTDGLKLSDADALRAEMYAAYHRAVAFSGAGDAVSASEAAKQMMEALSRYETLIGLSDGTGKAVSSLKAERQSLLTGTSTVRYSTESGYFYGADTVDGYESVRRAKGLPDRSADEILSLIQTGPDTVRYAAGKLITGFEWYLAIPVSAADGDTLKPDTRYNLTLTRPDGESTVLPMILESRKTASDGTCVLVFSCNRMSAELISCREVHISLVTGSVSGYRVPASALTERDGVDGVYILDESTVRFRKVTVLARYEGYCVVAKRDLSAEDYKDYLNRNDRLILDGKDLYDGKQYG